MPFAIVSQKAASRYMGAMTEYMTVTSDAPRRPHRRDQALWPRGFEGMRKAGQLAAETLDALVPHIVPGVTTGEIDDIVRRS
jgi:methionyl aminopeptidase